LTLAIDVFTRMVTGFHLSMSEQRLSLLFIDHHDIDLGVIDLDDLEGVWSPRACPAAVTLPLL
jgi:hypothetical protein